MAFPACSEFSVTATAGDGQRVRRGAGKEAQVRSDLVHYKVRERTRPCIERGTLGQHPHKAATPLHVEDMYTPGEVDKFIQAVRPDLVDWVSSTLAFP